MNQPTTYQSPSLRGHSPKQSFGYEAQRLLLSFFVSSEEKRKTKQFFFTLVLIIFFSNLSFSQQIDTMYVYPSTPSHGDSVYLVVHLTFPTTCYMNSYNVDISGSNINVDLNYCVSQGLMMCYRVHNIFLGVFNSGSFSLFFKLRVDNFAPCSSFSTARSQSLFFNVLPDCSNSTPPSSILIDTNEICLGDSIKLKINDGVLGTGASWLWFSDSCNGNNIGVGDSIFVSPTANKSYFVRADDCGQSTCKAVNINVIPPPIQILHYLGPNTSICSGDTLLLTAPFGYNYLWQDGSFNSFFTVTEQGTYFVEISNQCGSASDTVQITYQTPPVISLGNDTTLCVGDSLLLTTPYGYDYLWQDGSFDSIFTVTEQGIYFVQISNQCGSASDTVQITYQTPPVISLGNDTVVCAGDTFQLYAPANDYSLLWQNGSTDTVFSATSTDTYWLSVSNICGTNSDTIRLDFSYPFVDIGQDTVICNNTNISFDAGVWSSYEWSTGATVPTISLSSQDTLLAIWLIVEDEYGCVATDSVSVTFDPCLGKRSQELFSDVIIFPNPAKNEINIHIKNYDNSPFHCQIINPQGKQIKAFTISNETYLLNTQDISSGIYYLIIENKNQRINKKIIIIDN